MSANGKRSKSKQSKLEVPKLDKEAETIFDYLRRQNRPYSAQNVFDNLHGIVKKAQCQRILDSLSDQQLLLGKEYGKTKVYMVNQAFFSTTSPEELASIEQQIDEQKEEATALKAETKELSSKLKDLEGGLSLEEIEAQLESVQMAINEEETQIAELKAKGTVTHDEKTHIEQALQTHKEAERKRRKICTEMLNAIADMLDEPLRKVKDLVEFEDPE